MSKFQVGDKVKWQARGGDPEKQGTIVMVLPDGIEPHYPLLSMSLAFYKQHNIKFDPTIQRFHENYIIVTDKGKRGGKPSAYRPLVKNLKLVAEAAETNQP